MFLRLRNSHLLMIIILSTIILTIISDTFIVTNDLLTNSLKGTISDTLLNKFLHLRSIYWWIGSLVFLIITLTKIVFVVCCLYVGSIVYYPNVRFNIFLKIALISEFVFMFYNLIKLALLFAYRLPSLDEIQQFHPLTLFSLFDPVSIPILR